MRAYVFVYVYAYICVRINAKLYIYICVWLWLTVYIYTHIYKRVCTHTLTHTCTHTHTYIYIYIQNVPVFFSTFADVYLHERMSSFLSIWLLNAWCSKWSIMAAGGISGEDIQNSEIWKKGEKIMSAAEQKKHQENQAANGLIKTELVNGKWMKDEKSA